MTQNNGTPCYDADFDPFGGEHAYTNTCSQNYKFEGKERDTETGNDDFGARYYTSRFGRWLSADWSNVPVPVPYANLTNPQTLNLYAMVSDDPETSADLDGHAAGQGVQYSTPTCAASGQTGSSSDSGCGSQAPNLAQDMAQATEQSRQALDSAITTISQGLPGGSVMAGIEKAAWNFVAGAANLLSSGFDFKTVQAPILQGSNTDEKVTMGTVAAASVVVPIAVHALPSEVPESIPAGPSPRPTAAQQRAIDEMGEAHGCHTCGTPNPGTKTGKWVGDHQPSTKLNKGGGPQVYKPQCLACSRRQGGEVTAALRSASKTIVPQ
jgi:RHS repeat-associated protein